MGKSGPSEVEGHARYDMGLSDEDLDDITAAYNSFMREVNQVLVARGKFTVSAHTRAPTHARTAP